MFKRLYFNVPWTPKSFRSAFPNDAVESSGTSFGYEWVVKITHLGIRAGYVHIPPSHVWYSERMPMLEWPICVHGGITFQSFINDRDFFAIGFDCGHFAFGDAIEPGFDLNYGTSTRDRTRYFGVVRTREYAEVECKKMCYQVDMLNRSKVYRRILVKNPNNWLSYVPPYDCHI